VLSVAAVDRDAVRKYYRRYATQDDPVLWLGSAVERLGLRAGAPADVDVVTALLAGGRKAAEAVERAVVRQQTLRAIPTLPARVDQRAGFDLTFSAPKTVSVLVAGLKNEDLQRKVLEAHDAAVKSAVEYVEREAGKVRLQGMGVKAELLAAGFRHWTSRAGDPQLHTHVIVMNAGRVVAEDDAYRSQAVRAWNEPLPEPPDDLEITDVIEPPVEEWWLAEPVASEQVESKQTRKGFLSKTINKLFSKQDEPVVHEAWRDAWIEGEEPPIQEPPPDLMDEPPLQEQLEEGTWRAVDFGDMLKMQKAAGAVYRSELRYHLSQLGIAWQVGATGQWEVARLARERNGQVSLIRHFSRRSKAIEDKCRKYIEQRAKDGNVVVNQDLDPLQRVSGAAKKLASVLTREEKSLDQELDKANMIAYTQRSLEEDFQVTQRTLRSVFSQNPERATDEDKFAMALSDDDSLYQLADSLISGPHSGHSPLQNQAHFTRQQVTAALAETARRGVSAEMLEELTDRILAKCFIPLVPEIRDMGVPTLVTTAQRVHPRMRWAHPRTIEEEAAILAIAQQTTTTGLVPLRARKLEKDKRLAGLNEEQRNAVLHITSDPSRIVLVAGGPGAGKTSLVASAAKIWQEQGVRVFGLAHQGGNADALDAIEGIESGQTIDRLLTLIGAGKSAGFPKGSVVVLDEAGATDRRRLLAVAKLCEQSDSKLVLIGDDRQSMPIEAGGVFSLLMQTQGCARLEENRRQLYNYARQAVALARAGQGKGAVDWLRSAGKIEIVSDEASMLAAATEDLLEARSKGLGDSKAICHTIDQTVAINATMHTALEVQGVLGASVGVVAHGQEVCLGEEVAFQKNEVLGGIQVRNGRAGLVVKADENFLYVQERRSADLGGLRSDQRQEQNPLIAVPRDWAREHLALNYAITATKAIGRTVSGNVFVVGMDTMDANHALVAISRARCHTKVYLYGQRDEQGRISKESTERAIRRLTTKLSGVDQPVSAVQALLDEAQASKLAAQLGTQGCKRLAAIWGGYQRGVRTSIAPKQIDQARKVLNDPKASDQAVAEAQDIINLARVLDARTKAIIDGYAKGRPIDHAFIARQIEIANRGAEIAQYGVEYQGRGVAVSLSMAEHGDTPVTAQEHEMPKSVQPITARSHDIAGKEILDVAKKENLGLLEAVARWREDHKDQEISVTNTGLAISAQIARSAALLGTNLPAAVTTNTILSLVPELRTSIEQERSVDMELLHEEHRSHSPTQTQSRGPVRQLKR
jgi:hypothetical protein